MKPIFIYFIFFVFYSQISRSQTIDFQSDIQPIIQKNCSPCHYAGGPAPFSLTSYKDLVKRKEFIKIVTETRYMPPWFADNDFQTYHNTRTLSQKEIDIIGKWATQSNENADFTAIKWAPDLPSNYIGQSIEIPFNKPFTIQDDNTEQFRVFVLPTNINQPTFIKGIDFIPGYKPVAHHNRIMIDTTRKLRADDGIEVGASSEFERLNIKLADQFWYGWVPGKQAIFYPKGMARILPAQSDLVINMHYAPSSRRVEDLSKVVLYPINEKDTINRIVQTYVMDEQSIVNQPFEIKADTVIKFYMRSPIIPYDISVLSVLPHLHLLGKNVKCYAISTEGELIPLIKIDDWNFNWQMNYQFKNLLKIPKGSVIFAEAEFDNTKSNLKNPFNPPQNIKYGWGTKDEMFNLIFEFVPYKTRDEEIKF